MAIAQTLLTAEELERLPNPTDLHRELVQGVLVEMSPVGGGHGSLVGKLIIRLGNWAERGTGGYVGTEAGFILAHDPDTIRAADIAYVRADRIPTGYWSLAPISPSRSSRPAKVRKTSMKKYATILQPARS
ncbi:MAG: Uma2 family endonuclease [Herpetosiphonaceae bacterium]|nr:Uma2 family endonuclease [Herpetosiphonaceae bacterium]